MNIQKAVKQSQKLMYASIAILLLTLVFISQFIEAYIEIENDLKQVVHSVDEVLHLKNELLLDKNIKVIGSAGGSFERLNIGLTNLQKHLGRNELDYREEIVSLQNHASQLRAHFEHLVALQIEYGLSETEGLRGQFRQAAHSLQDIFKLHRKIEWNVLILEIRRREKDYLLRGYSRYLDMQNELFVQLKDSVLASELQQSDKEQIIQLIDQYDRLIDLLAINLNTQGLNSNQGLRAKLLELENKLKQSSTELTQLVAEHTTQRFWRYLFLSFTFIMMFIATSSFWLVRVNRRIFSGLNQLTQTMQRITGESDFTLRFEETQDDEFNLLVEHLNDLLIHFEQVLRNLDAARDRMIQSEKLASLVGMVSGVAHELNTPLGVALTCESIIKERITQLQKDFERGEIKKSNLEQIITDSKSSVELLETNLERTNQLITQFKEMTSFKSYDEAVEFNLYTLVESVAMALNQEFEKIECELVLSIDQDTKYKGYSGAIAQVLQLIFVNCIRHAYNPPQTLRIEVVAENEENDCLVIKVMDNGRGISSEHMDKVFEPFYTTRRNQGGTGLGLSVAFNLVNQRLGGEIDVQQNQPNGVVITLKIPKMTIIDSSNL